jgi:hypothetical protein
VMELTGHVSWSRWASRERRQRRRAWPKVRVSSSEQRASMARAWPSLGRTSRADLGIVNEKQETRGRGLCVG